MLRTKTALSFFFILTLSIFSQEMRTMTFSADNSFLLKELTAIIQLTDGKLVLEMIPEQILQQEKFKDINLKQGDEILFVNGKKVKNIKDITEAYEAIETGQEIKLGIKRDKERFFATLIKEKLPEGKEHMMIIGGGDNNGENPAIERSVQINGKKMDLDSLQKAGKIKVVPQKKKKDDE